MKKYLILPLVFCTALFATEDEDLFLHTNVPSLEEVIYATGIACTRIECTTNGCRIAGLQKHLEECKERLTPGEEGYLVADSNFSVLFTAKGHSDENVKKHIASVLSSIKDVSNEKKIISKLMQLKEIYRATFIEKNGRLVFVDQEDMLTVGDIVWRKYEDRVEKVYFHNDIECLTAISEAGLHCTEIKRPCFFGGVKYDIYHRENPGATLGEAYKNSHPFTIYTFVQEDGIS